MAKEYIKRVDLENRLHALCAAQRITAQDAIDIAILPAADVAPVKHGKWLKRDDMPRIVECKCSACGYADYPSKNDRYWFERNFCPNCGADMRTSEEPESLTYIPPEERSGVDDG